MLGLEEEEESMNDIVFSDLEARLCDRRIRRETATKGTHARPGRNSGAMSTLVLSEVPHALL
ncbi:hypothetical protein REMIM1_PE00306 (plasmid) [Rhizobium etli bv. mimosae str. Mim1]|nr:hypothetical protein REMIM1_PE00306 [Rhizobium etli bv. mimosae str. Mim1]